MNIQRPPSRQPLPPDAACVFKGIIFDVYQWEQVDFEGRAKTFEKLKRPDTAIVLPMTPEGKILYSFEEQPGKEPFLGCLGGRVDEGEDVLTAAKRELREEAGYEADEWTLFEAIQPASKIEWCIYTFIAKGCRKIDEQSLDGGEKIEIRSANFEEFIKVVTRPDFAEGELRAKFLEALIDPEKMQTLKKLFTAA